MEQQPHTPVVVYESPRFIEHCRTPKRRKDLRHRQSTLQLVGCSRVHLTPKARKLHSLASGLRKTARALDRECCSLKERLQKANEFANSEEFFRAKVNKPTYNFIMSQLNMQKKKSKGRRFSLDDKVLALSLMKQSPKGYRLLERIFALPCRKTLNNLLQKVPFKCGIVPEIINNLKLSVSKMNEKDRFCILMYDEMSVDAALSYNRKSDNIIGFENCGEGVQKPVFADHAMVFLARGICKKWKQPICFFLSESGMKTPHLVRNIKQVIRALHSTGLRVVATVSDQLSINVAAIKALREETHAECLRNEQEDTYHGFVVDGQEIVPLYDFPHLLKGVRNNMLDGNVKFTWEKAEQVASWEDIVKFYEMDVGSVDYKMCNKLTDFHIYKHKLKKMKVKMAAQVFSQRVSSVMRAMVRLGVDSVPASAADTADFLLFIDQLFDSVNGSTIEPQHGKRLRCAVTASSPHIAFWNAAIQVLLSVKFFSKTRKEYVPPTIKNWISTIKGLKYLWTKLQGKGGLTFLCPRGLNQDPVENFFTSIRSHGARNINPTCVAFTASFKSLVVNNFMSAYSPGSNCEDDDCEGALDTLKTFLALEEAAAHEENFTATTVDPVIVVPTSEIDVGTHAYIAGFVARKILRMVKGCATCKGDLVSDVRNLREQFLLRGRAYGPKALLFPNTVFFFVF